MTLLKLFAVLFAVNLLTVGGGYVALPVLHRFFVEDFGWLTSAELADSVAVGQLSPGPMTIMNVFIGHKVAGLAGAVTAAVASYLPSVAVGSFLARSYPRLRRSAIAAAVLRGMKPAVVGILLAVAVQLAGIAIVDRVTLGLAAGSFAVVACTRIDPTLVVAVAAAAGAALL